MFYFFKYFYFILFLFELRITLLWIVCRLVDSNLHVDKKIELNVSIIKVYLAKLPLKVELQQQN